MYVTTDDPRAIEKAREPQAPRPGLVRTPRPGTRCTANGCRDLAVDIIATKTQARPFCDAHKAIVLADLKARRKRRLRGVRIP